MQRKTVAVALLLGAFGANAICAAEQYRSHSAADAMPVPDCIGESGINCLRGAEALFHGGTLLYIDGAYGCDLQPSATKRVSELINHGGYHFAVEGFSVHKIPIARIVLSNGDDIRTVLSREGLATC